MFLCSAMFKSSIALIVVCSIVRFHLLSFQLNRFSVLFAITSVKAFLYVLPVVESSNDLAKAFKEGSSNFKLRDLALSIRWIINVGEF